MLNVSTVKSIGIEVLVLLLFAYSCYYDNKACSALTPQEVRALSHLLHIQITLKVVISLYKDLLNEYFA